MLDGQIQKVYTEHKQRYGVPRITDELKDRGFHCSKNRVARRMQTLGFKGVQAQKFKRTTDSSHDKPVAPDLINQDFTAAAPNQKWVSESGRLALSLSGRHHGSVFAGYHWLVNGQTNDSAADV